VVVSGATSGDADKGELQRLFFLQLNVVGSTMGTRDELADLVAYLDREGIKPRIGAEFELADAAQGVKAMIDGDTAGKIVFTL